MKLITKAIENKMKKYPLYSQDGKGLDADVLVKFFNPYGRGTWIITEAQPEDDDIMMYGYCSLYPGEWEWGYVSFNELQKQFYINAFGNRLPVTIERDMMTYKNVREALKLMCEDVD